jgi:multicomponent K+:H+ antiporter subunit E
MSVLLAQPMLSLVLLACWLLLNVSLHPAHWLLGTILALAIPRVLRPLAVPGVVPRQPRIALRLASTVLADIVRSNVTVARRVLGREERIRPRFAWVPLDIRNEYGVAMLAGIVTMTPGTVSAELAPGATHLLVHAFDVDDEAALVAGIKQRYEAPLMAMFP